MRWDLVEKFELIKKGKTAKAVKSFSGNEDFFSDHFPGDPCVPATLLIEMVAQAGGVLFGFGLDFKKEVVLVKIDEAHFEKTVAPPCRFLIEANLEEEREDGAWIEGSVRCEGEIVMRVRLLLAAVDSLEGQKQVVFNEEFIKHFDIYAVAKKSEGMLV